MQFFQVVLASTEFVRYVQLSCRMYPGRYTIENISALVILPSNASFDRKANERNGSKEDTSFLPPDILFLFESIKSDFEELTTSIKEDEIKAIRSESMRIKKNERSFNTHLIHQIRTE